MKIVKDVLNLLAFEGNGVATPFPEFSRDHRICVGFESCEEPAAVGVDQIHRPVIEVGLVEQQQRVLHPRTSRELCEFMRARVSDAEFSRETATDGFDHVELRSSVVVAIAGKRIEQRLVQRDDGRIRDEDLAELLEAALKTLILVFEVLKSTLEDLSKELTECGHEPIVKRGIAEGAVVRLDVFLAELFESSVVTGEEADSERPEQSVSFQLPSLTLD